MNTDFKTLVGTVITNVFDPLVVLISGVAVIYFLIGVLKYIQSTESEEKRKEGVTMMTYGIIGLFVMVAMWGLVNVLVGTFPLNPTRPKVPSVSGSSSTFAPSFPSNTGGTPSNLINPYPPNRLGE